MCKSLDLYHDLYGQPLLEIFPMYDPPHFFGLQKLLAGPSEFLGHGVVRNVSMVEYNGKPLVVKKLIHQEKESHQEKHLEMHRREVLALDAVSDERVLSRCPWEIPFMYVLHTSCNTFRHHEGGLNILRYMGCVWYSKACVQRKVPYACKVGVHQMGAPASPIR